MANLKQTTNPEALAFVDRRSSYLVGVV